MISEQSFFNTISKPYENPYFPFFNFFFFFPSSSPLLCNSYSLRLFFLSATLSYPSSSSSILRRKPNRISNIRQLNGSRKA